MKRKTLLSAIALVGSMAITPSYSQESRPDKSAIDLYSQMNYHGFLEIHTPSTQNPVYFSDLDSLRVNKTRKIFESFGEFCQNVINPSDETKTICSDFLKTFNEEYLRDTIQREKSAFRKRFEELLPNYDHNRNNVIDSGDDLNKDGKISPVEFLYRR